MAEAPSKRLKPMHTIYEKCFKSLFKSFNYMYIYI